MSLKISFANQKGGIQKTSLTIVMASTIHYGSDWEVVVIDADGQNSLSQRRMEDFKDFKDNETLQKKLTQKLEAAGKNMPYEIVQASLTDGEVIKTIKLYEKKNIDLIVVDLPGSLEVNNMGETLNALDYIIVPFYVGEMEKNSTKTFISILKEGFLNKPGSSLKEICVVFTRYPTNERSEDIHHFEEWREKFKRDGIHVFENTFKNSSAFINKITDQELIDFGIAKEDATERNKKNLNTILPFPRTKKFAKIDPIPLMQEISYYLSNK